MNSRDVNNRSCCVLRDVYECCQACSFTNIMCRAACIASVLHECFQSVIISLWRSGPVWLCPFWDMIVFSRQDYSQYVMLWCDRNKVHGIFEFLFLLLIWVLQIVIACAASGSTTIDYWLFLSLRRDLCWWGDYCLPYWMDAMFVFPWVFWR